jgi:hypothetical protein
MSRSMNRMDGMSPQPISMLTVTPDPQAGVVAGDGATFWSRIGSHPFSTRPARLAAPLTAHPSDGPPAPL